MQNMISCCDGFDALSEPTAYEPKAGPTGVHSGSRRRMAAEGGLTPRVA
jgi:hypothetical protein